LAFNLPLAWLQAGITGAEDSGPGRSLVQASAAGRRVVRDTGLAPFTASTGSLPVRIVPGAGQRAEQHERAPIQKPAVTPRIPALSRDEVTAGWTNRRQPAARSGGGQVLPPLGGSGAAAPLSTRSNAGTSANGAVASASSSNGASLGLFLPSTGATSAVPTVTRNAAAIALQATGRSNPGGSGGNPSGGPSDPGTAGSAIVENAWSVPDTTPGNNSPAALGSFPYFPMYTLDYNNGIVLFPGQYQQATLGGSVDLRAQVRDTTGVTFSWDTTHLTEATGITGAATYRLQFTWNAHNSPATVDYTTLTVTNGSSQQESQTYYFQVPSSNVVSLPSSASWPETVPADTVRPEAPAFASHNVSVDANSGAVDTTIALPSYNPIVPPIALTYDSLTADPRPIVLEHHTIDPAQTVPTKVSAQLTFNSVAGTAYYYDTSKFTPGDIQAIALQASPTSPSTGRYSYSVQVIDYRTTNTTFTLNGTATILSNASSAFGAGWDLQGLEKITSATGGVILDLGGGGTSLWFTGSGGTYTDPAGEFSTLVKNGDNTYIRTLVDGTKINFDTSGNQTSLVDRNGLRTTFAYSSGLLSTITDPYGKVTTFTYASSKLQSITDPAGRLTTFTISGGTLNQVQQADGSLVSYTYDGSSRLTQVKDQNARVVTVVYDGAFRASTITRPDGTTETFVPYQERGYNTTGTSGSPAPATLLAESRATHTDPNSHTTDLRSDWGGLGLTNQATDPDGNVTSLDLNSNGLAAVAVDRLNRIDQYTYDSNGNVTNHTYPDLNSDQYTYNSFPEPLTHTDPNSHITSYVYDGNGNLTSTQDPLNNLTTMTYTANGRLQTVKDARSNVTSFQYDSQDRLTTITYPDGTTNLVSYDSKGNAVTVTDERTNSTTYSYDALNRTTGMTDALGNRTTYGYDPAGNLTSVQAPLSRTTNYAYDSMNRLASVTDPLNHITTYGYDSAGNLQTIKDPLSRVTSLSYDPEDRLTVVQDPMGNRTTTSYDAEGQRLTVTDALSRVTSYSYSNRGFLSTVTDPMGYIVTYVYSAAGELTAQYQYQQGQFQSAGYTYDANHRVTTYADGLGHNTSYSYDGVGNLTAVGDANSNTTTYVYDFRNRLGTITDALGHSTVYGYDSAGNRQAVTDALGHTTTTLYDALNRAATIVSAVNGTTTILYDAAGRESTLVDPVGNRTTWSYDAADRLTTYADPLNHQATYVYDSANQLTDTTDRDGRRTTIAYDNAGRQTGETWVAGSRSITYVYDAAGQMTGATDASATLTFAYDSDGRLATAVTSGTGTGQPNVTLTYGYDQLGDRTSLTDSLSSQGLTTFGYDSAQRMTTITTSYGGTTGPQVTYVYDGANRLTSIWRLSGFNYTNTTIMYDNADRVTTISHYSHVPGGHSSYINTPLATYVYAYDNANRVTSEQDKEGTATFTYDNANELTAVGGSRTESYGYDANGNRNTTGYSTGTGNELTNSTGHTYTYDNEGSLIADNNGSSVTSYSYDYRNRLTGVTAGGTKVATYVYDALDRRIGVQDSGTQTWTVFDGHGPTDAPYADFNGSGSLTNRYLSGPGVVLGAVVDQILARTSAGGTTAWYLPDNLGTVRDIADTSVTVIYHAVYDSFGNINSETGAANGDRFKFAGMQYDPTIIQYYDHARWYAPVPGRFDTPDPVGFSTNDPNLYRYVMNNASNRIDATGLYQEGGGPPPGEVAKAEQGYHPYFQLQMQQAHKAALEERKRIEDSISRAQKARKPSADTQVKYDPKHPAKGEKQFPKYFFYQYGDRRKYHWNAKLPDWVPIDVWYRGKDGKLYYVMTGSRSNWDATPPPVPPGL
jgi:RHS repeat-associated protein